MFRSPYINNNIKYLHERCLRLIYNVKGSSYDELLQKTKKNGSVCIQHKTFQELPIGIFKVEKTLNTDIMKYIFMESNVNWQDKTRQDKINFGACGQNHKEHMQLGAIKIKISWNFINKNILNFWSLFLMFKRIICSLSWLCKAFYL